MRRSIDGATDRPFRVVDKFLVGRIGEPPCADWAELLSQVGGVADELADRPFAVFGHSLGAMIAYELARRTADGAGAAPCWLLLAGCRAPDVPLLVQAIHRLPDEEFARSLSLVTATPQEVLADRRMMGLVLPLMRADLTLAETWPPAEPTRVRLPATVFVGLQDTFAPPWSARGWSHFAGPLTIHVLPGDHFFIHSVAGSFLEMLATIWRRPPPVSVRPGGACGVDLFHRAA
jgi:medium-chain acyl-[acyl-carrier-protein] hydrolase